MDRSNEDPESMDIISHLWKASDLLNVFSNFQTFQKNTLKHAYTLRKMYTDNGIWGIPCQEGIHDIAQFADGPILEVMGGTGYLSYWLQTVEHVNVVCTDVFENHQQWNIGKSKQWVDVEKMKASDAIDAYPGRAVMVSWIPYGGCDDQDEIIMLNTMLPEQKLILIGETSGGCCADDDFFEVLDRDFELSGIGQWVSALGIHDRLLFYVKKA